MALRDYWRVFKRRAWIPAVLAIAAIIAAAIVVYSAKPSYAASATVLVKTGTGTPAVGFVQAATSNSVALAVSQTEGLNESVDQLAKRIHVTFAGGTTYRVTVTDPNPDQAARIANDVARQAATLFVQMNTQGSSGAADQALVKARDDLWQQYAAAVTARVKFLTQHPNPASSKDVNIVVQDLQLQVLQDSAGGAYRSALDQISRMHMLGVEQASTYDARLVDQAVAKPDIGGRLVEILTAGALALFVGIGIVFLLEYLDTAIREPEVAEEIIGAPVIGVIPRANPHTLRAVKGGA
jgi:capsular polysaccharide biosynthesis protein